MFNQQSFQLFLENEKNRTTLLQAADVQRALNDVFYDQQSAVRAIVLAALSGEPCLLIGPPGTAKSMLVRRFCSMAGIKSHADIADANAKVATAEDVDYFEYLLTPFTEPTELFGAFRLDDQRRLVREQAGMLHRCRVAFLDEVFNGSSAILNALLALMNERIFHDRGVVHKARLEVLFGATNRVPSEGGDSAAYDRFTIRARVSHIDEKPKELRNLLEHAAKAEAAVTDPDPGLLGRFSDLRDAFHAQASHLIDLQSPDPKVLENLNHLIGNSRAQAVGSFSNRRIVRTIRLMAWHRLLRAATEQALGDAAPGQAEYDLVTEHLVDAMDEPLEVYVQDIFDSLPHVPGASASQAQ